MEHLTIQSRGYRTPEPKEGMLIGDLVPKELKKSVIAGIIDGRPIDLSEKVPAGGQIGFITLDSPEGVEILRHSTSHIMAEAVQSLFPDVKVTIGPAIDNGFYYDFDTPKPFEPEDLERIEKRMTEIIKRDRPFVRKVLPVKEAVEYFRQKEKPISLSC